MNLRMFGIVAFTAVACLLALTPNAEACLGGAPGMRCAPAPGTPASEPKYDMARKSGRASAQRQEVQPDVIYLTVTGKAAELIYNDLKPTAIYETEFEQGVIQIVGPNMTCYENPKKQKSGAIKKHYSCDIGITRGATLSGAAG